MLISFVCRIGAIRAGLLHASNTIVARLTFLLIGSCGLRATDTTRRKRHHVKSDKGGIQMRPEKWSGNSHTHGRRNMRSVVYDKGTRVFTIVMFYGSQKGEPPDDAGVRVGLGVVVGEEEATRNTNRNAQGSNGDGRGFALTCNSLPPLARVDQHQLGNRANCVHILSHGERSSRRDTYPANQP